MSPASRVPRLRHTAVAALALLALTPAAAHALGATTTGWVTDGPVSSAVTDDAGRTYIAGEFSVLGPRFGSAIALTTTDDQPAAGFPDVVGSVSAVIADGTGGWFVGGTFTSVGGLPRTGLAHILADRTVDPTWNPSLHRFAGDGLPLVQQLVRQGTTLYVGGRFDFVGGEFHRNLVKLSTEGTGALVAGFAADVGRVSSLAVAGASLLVSNSQAPYLVKLATADGQADGTWDPGVLGGIVQAMAVAADGLYIGGQFNTVGGVTRNGVAKVSLSGSGTVDPTFDPNVGGPAVKALVLDGANLYLGGRFFTVGGQARTDVARVAAGGTGAVQPWAPLAVDVNALAVDGDAVYVAGGLLRRVSATTGQADAWRPNPDGGEATGQGGVQALAVAGNAILAGGTFATAGKALAPRRGLARLNPDGSLDLSWTSTPLAFDGGTVAVLALDGDSLFVGGSFWLPPTIGSRTLVKFSASTGELDAAWSPAVPRRVTALALGGGSLFVAQQGTIPQTDTLLKVSATGTGSTDATWQPSFGNVAIFSMAVSGSSLYVGGLGLPAPNGNVAKLPTGGTGAVDATWDPDTFGAVRALAVAGGDVILGGNVHASGQPLNNLLKVSAGGTGAVDLGWAPNPNGDVTALAVAGPDVYVGGSFGKVRNQPHFSLARVPLAGNGEADATFDPSADGTPAAITASADRVVVAGPFTSTGTLSTVGVATFDLNSPSISLTVPADGGRYRAGQAYPAAFACTDPDGPANLTSCAGPVATGSPIDTTTAGPHTFTVTAVDVGGNAATKTVTYTVDASAPTIAFDALPSGGRYGIGEKAVVTYRCSDADGGPDIATCAGAVPSGGLLDTAKAGEKSFTVTATDLVGNTASATVAYSVRPDRAKPVLSALVFSPTAFRAEKAGSPNGKATTKKLKRGSKVSFKLSEPGRVTFTVIVPKKGKVKAKTLGTFTVLAKQGTTKFVFRGRIRGRTLKPGSLQVTAQARDTAGLKSAVLRKTIRIRR